MQRYDLKGTLTKNILQIIFQPINRYFNQCVS